MISDFVMTQKDVQTDLTKPDPIGMGSYNGDSHNVQRILKLDGTVESEGDMQVPVTPYQIPYRMVIPKHAQAGNLLVPVCFSASHVASSSLRMEPQYMMLGQAAGAAAALAIRSQKNVQDIDVGQLVHRLKEQGVILEYHPAAAQPPSIRELSKKGMAGVDYSPELF
jgi:FAD dependent oxidoreductase